MLSSPKWRAESIVFEQKVAGSYYLAQPQKKDRHTKLPDLSRSLPKRPTIVTIENSITYRRSSCNLVLIRADHATYPQQTGCEKQEVDAKTERSRDNPDLRGIDCV